jgi:hypothetical protein
MPDSALREAQFFLRRCTAPLRMLPGFLIIGAQKSGTTTLYNYLNQHPAVGPSFTQEVHFFDLNFQRGLDWYRAHFPTIFQRQLTKFQSGMELTTGEASAYYLFHPHVCWRVRKTLPDVRLLVVLRDPTERAWAHYLHNRRAFEPLSFEDAIEQEEERLLGERLRLLRDEAATSFTYREFSYLSRGVYVDQIRAWMAIFPREQIHIACSEDLLFKDPAAVVERVQRFLGLPIRRPDRLRTYRREPKVAMNEATQRRLREHFRTHNQRLFDYLGIDFEWER